MAEQNELGDQVAALVDRVKALEDDAREVADVQALTQLVAGYGPTVDGGDGPGAAGIFADAGTMAAPPHGTWDGREQIAAMLTGTTGMVAAHGVGMGHVLLPLHVQIDGDEAHGWNHALILQLDAESGAVQIGRLAANRWHFVREGGGWRVASRSDVPLDGAAAARELFAGIAPR